MSSDANQKQRLFRLLNFFGPFLILLFVTGLFAGLLALRDAEGLKAFFSLPNFKTILIQTVIVAIGALGMTMIIISGGIDLSVGSVIALTGVLAAVLLKANQSSFVTMTISILAGGAIGLVNGSLIAGFRMTPFIVTLGMLGVARGAAKWLAGNQTVNSERIPNSAIASLMQDPDLMSLKLPAGVLLVIVLAALMALVLRQTIFGRYIFAIGSNETAALMSGVRTRRIKILIYTVAGLFVGLAGVMQLSRLRQGDPTAAIGLELDIIAAVVIGGASLSGGSGSVLGSMIGALTMAVLRTGSQYMDWPNYMQEIIIGVLIILAVGLDRFRQNRQNALA